MTYPLFLIYIVMTAATIGIVSCVSFMVLSFLAPAIEAYLDAKAVDKSDS